MFVCDGVCVRARVMCAQLGAITWRALNVAYTQCSSALMTARDTTTRQRQRQLDISNNNNNKRDNNKRDNSNNNNKGRRQRKLNDDNEDRNVAEVGVADVGRKRDGNKGGLGRRGWCLFIYVM